MNSCSLPDAHVSVIIPTYNRAEMAGEAVASVLHAAGSDLTYEVVLVDDGSDVSQAARLKKLCNQPCLRYVRLESNSGPQIARNAGLAMAAGEYIKFLDSDDVLMPGALAEEYREIRELDCDLLVSGWLISRGELPTADEAALGKPQAYPGNWYDAVLAGFGAPISAVLYKRRAIGDVRWDTAVQHPDDWLFLIKVLLREPKVCVREVPVFLWRQHQGPRQSSATLIEYARARFFILDFVQKEMTRRNALTPARRQALADYFYRDIYLAHRFDRPHYRRVLERLDSLVPGYQPSGHVEPHWLMRRWGKLIGYRGYIRLHNLAGRVARSLGIRPK